MDVALALIVRDAAPVVERCIRSALPLVSRYTVIDTGSQDDTVEVVERVTAEAGIPGQILRSEWVGHAHNRSELLRLARHGCDYVMMLDADMELVQTGTLPELTADAYLLRIKDRGLEYPLPLLTKASKPFFYAGVAHCYLACSEPHENAVLLHELHLLDHGGGGHREGKIERDAELLGAEVAKNPLDRRSWFYLAQSYRDLGQIEKAIACYRMRASLGGWDEEVYNALYAAGTLLCEHISYHEGAPLLLEAFKLMPGRAEALRSLAGSTTSVADKIPFPKNDLLFVRPGAYKHQAKRVAKPEVEEIFFHRYKPRPGDVVVELGAAEGTETPLLRQLVGDQGKLVAVEAHPKTFARLRALGLEEHVNVNLLNVAVAAKAGNALLTDGDNIWRNHLIADGEGIKVRARTLDAITRDLDRIDFLKINIEGAEADVLAVSQKTLAKTRNVVVSCHDFVGRPTKKRTCEALEQAGFAVFIHDDPLIIEDGHQGRCLGDYLYAKRTIEAEQVSAALVTRGNVDLTPILDVLPFNDVHIWDNSKRENLKTYGRVKILDECQNDIIFTVDDDVIFTAFQELLDAYEPGLLVCNMDQPWIDGAGYGDWHHLTGAGSIYDRDIPRSAVERYLASHPYDDEFLTWCDAIVGTLAPGKRVDLGYQVREFSDDPGRLWTTPGNPERKWEIINRCRAMRQIAA